MRVLVGFSAVIVAFQGILLAPAILAEDAVPPAGADVLRSVLRAEKREAVDRRQHLAALRKTSNLAARWQSGYVELDESWMPFESAGRTGDAAELRDEYRQRRQAAPLTADGQGALAAWCRAHQLSAQDYAHALAAVALDPEGDHRETLTRLGYLAVGDKWLSPDEAARWAAEIESTKESLKLWGEKLTMVAGQLSSPGRKREAALRTLDQLRDGRCAPAIEWTLCGHSEPVALVGIGRLKQIRAYESTKTLARQAVFNPWPAVRHAAIEALFDRKFEDYVPALVSLLSTTLEARFETHQDDRDFLTYSYVVSRETESEFQVQAFQTLVRVIEPTLIIYSTRPGASKPGRDESPKLRLPANLDLLNRVDLERNLLDQYHVNAQRQEIWNARTEELNGRVRDVLVSVTGEAALETPRDWWDWWDGYNQYEKTEKKIRSVTRKQFAGRIAGNHLRIVRSSLAPSCLAAGTPVWTDRGAIAVQQLAVGDELLTQDIETGALGYVPVLETTRRDPTSVFKITAGAGSPLVATGGHRFWVPGEGWRRVNDLKPGSLLHTATGSVAVTSIESLPDAAVYNVVLSPTHNCFVGEQALLTHDVTLPRSTNRQVPGLIEP